MPERTRLEYTLMCLIWRAPRTGASLVSTLRASPIGGHGQSSGAVYPALRRLRRDGLVNSRDKARSEFWAWYREWHRERGPREAWPKFGDPNPSTRRYQEFSLTPRGLDELRSWSIRPVTRADMLARPDYLMLRFAFLSELGGMRATRQFVAQYADIAWALRGEVARLVRSARAGVSPSSKLALELSLAELDVRIGWAQKALAELRARPGTGARDGDDQDFELVFA